ncbi:hypothetical protein IC235_11780 [Hymenobacter sp. BT664]|uniref:Organic solvent tolerance-like N-terminal domain-containing protein n=1 Tax=Hymenobacter montanus TaxID=2771359 RepID=A0A927GJX5_9BACT|nr:hypothetical protein [Hymenobacter montanus]MBD2768566.1 hypothetical protein [Hymenobacter montanus]
MKSPLFISFLLIILLSISSLSQARAQALEEASSAESAGSLPWFTLQDNALIIRNGSKTKPLERDIMLPSGVRIDYRSKSVVFANGTRVKFQEGDVLSLNGDFIANTRNPSALSASPEPSAAPAAAPTAAPGAAAASPERPAAPGATPARSSSPHPATAN